jgi:competence protein ComEC
MKPLPSFFYQTPFFRLLLPFIAGIVVASHISIAFGLPALLSAMVTFLFLMFFLTGKDGQQSRSRTVLLGICVNIFLFLSGITTVVFHLFTPEEQAERGIWTVVVEEPPVERENSMQVVLKTRAFYVDGLWNVDNEKIMAYIRKDSLSQKIRQGDLLLIDTELRPVTNAGNPFEFDYQSYLNRKQIGRSAFVEKDSWKYLSGHAREPLKNFTGRIRNHLLEVFKTAGLSGNELAVASALVLGYRAELNDEIRNAYSASGAMHVLAVSGLHTGIVYFIMNLLLSLIPVLQRVRILKSFLLLVALWLYALMTGMSPSVMRATVMFSFIVTGEIFHRKLCIWNSIAASAFFLLLINPFNLLDVGFQLSYMAVISIVFFHSRFYSLLSFKNRLAANIWKLVCVSIAAQLGTMPLSLYYFHQFPGYFILSNLTVVPAATVIMYGALFLIPASTVPALLNVCGWLLDKFLYLVNLVIFTIEKLPGSVIWPIRFAGWEVAVLYLLLATLSIWLQSERKSFLFASLSLCLFWSSATAVRNYQDMSRQQLIVYNSRGNSLVQFINGRDNLVWYQSRNTSFDVRKMIENVRVARRLKDADCIRLDSALVSTGRHYSGIYSNRNFIGFAEKRIAVFSGNCRPGKISEKLKVDIIILTQNTNAEIRQLIAYHQPETVVIDASSSPNRMDLWEKDCIEAGVNCHRVDRNGAFVANY